MRLKYLFACLLSIVTMSILLQTAVFAQSPGGVENNNGPTCSQRFLTFPAWYRGVVDGNCNIKSPTSPEFGGLPGFIWRIGLNLVEIILNLVGYAAVGFIIYGGYKYMTSTGTPDGMIAARKTIMNATIGLVLSIAAVAIVNTVVNAF